MRKHLTTLTIVLTVLGGILIGAEQRLWAFPKPSVYPKSWELKFEHDTPKRIVVNVPGKDVPQAYWYMTFNVTNNSGTEQQFMPIFDMLTNEGKVVRSDTDILPVVFDAIKHAEPKKLLEPLHKVAGRVLLGDDQARDCVAIWPEATPVPRMGTFEIFVGGLSGETVTVKNGEVVDTTDWRPYSPEERKTFVVLQKTLEMDYQINGDEIYPGEDKVDLVKEDWIMR